MRRKSLYLLDMPRTIYIDGPGYYGRVVVTRMPRTWGPFDAIDTLTGEVLHHAEDHYRADGRGCR